MKRSIILITVAALALVGCTKVQDVYIGAPQEIAFKAIATPATKAAIQSEVFPAGNSMEIACYQSAPETAANYFTKMTFSKDGDVWTGGENAKYWPLSKATLNFFAVSGAGLTASHVTIADNLASASVAYTSANSYAASGEKSQIDIMYAFNRGSVTQSGNGLTIPGSVGMVFNHALGLVNFQIKAANDASTAISISKIELNGARYTGTLAITNTNAATVSDAWSAQLDWTPDDVVNNVVVPNIGNVTTPVALTTSYVPENTTTTSAEGNAWAALMIIPRQQKVSPENYGFTTFKIYYRFNNKNYTYEYAPAGYTGDTPNLTVVQAGKKYTYQISMQLHEITVTPSVTQWADETGGPYTLVI